MHTSYNTVSDLANTLHNLILKQEDQIESLTKKNTELEDKLNTVQEELEGVRAYLQEAKDTIEANDRNSEELKSRFSPAETLYKGHITYVN